MSTLEPEGISPQTLVLAGPCELLRSATVGDERMMRLAAFAHLEELQRRHGELLPWSALTQGFVHQGQVVRLLGPQGIFKPVQFRLPLSIATAPEKPGKPRPYDDEIGADGFLRYRYRGTDPQHGDNRGLRECGRDGIPLVYFHGVSSGWYQAFWPVYIHGDDPDALTFTVAVDDPAMLRPDLIPEVVDDARRAYVTRLAVQRLHQAGFRHRVLTAYRTTCAICRLKAHRELLDAAHILPDGHPRGLPVVSNGMALCKIHHAAYDWNVIGIRPDLVVEVSEKVLAERDGPMLRHGIQELNGSRLTVPRRTSEQPDREALGERFEEYRAVS